LKARPLFPKDHGQTASVGDQARPKFTVFLVHLAGALSNRSGQEKLERLDALRRRLLRQAAQAPRQAKRLRLRNGAVQEAVLRVLATSPEPMRVADVHAAVERLLSMPVSRDSVNSCLSVGARGAEAPFERVKIGWYRVRP
jgi:hypothetical protein